VDGLQDRRSAVPPQRGRPAASIAHEINNPLNCVLDLLYLLETEANLTEKGRQYLTLVREEVRHASQIAQEALHGSRGTAGPEKTNVPNLVGSVVDFYKARFEARGISVNTRYCPDGDLPVYAGSLRQVFSNLLLNAADAMPHGGRVRTSVSMAHEWSGQKRHGLRVTFADTGCGIAAENLPRVLEPFFTTKGSGGNGLGLPFVRDIVQKHRGVLRVRSSTKPGRSGTVFSIFLPAA
jgi:two-component system, chemotaxis family, CheB/CheR fusion protein